MHPSLRNCSVTGSMEVSAQSKRSHISFQLAPSFPHFAHSPSALAQQVSDWCQHCENTTFLYVSEMIDLVLLYFADATALLAVQCSQPTPLALLSQNPYVQAQLDYSNSEAAAQHNPQVLEYYWELIMNIQTDVYDRKMALI